MEGVFHGWKPKVWSPDADIQITPSTIVYHSYVIESLLYVNVTNKADYRPGLNVPFQPDWHYLLPNQLIILRFGWGFLLLYETTAKLPYEEVQLAKSNFLLVLLGSIPKEWCRPTNSFPPCVQVYRIISTVRACRSPYPIHGNCSRLVQIL